VWKHKVNHAGNGRTKQRSKDEKTKREGFHER
jgi:hypothetical protein